MTTFIYKPRSGDRVFVERPSAHVVITTWANGCRDVAGSLVALEWDTAQPTFHWRALARRALTEVVTLLQAGIAWDLHGRIYCLVRSRDALSVASAMQRIRPFPSEQEDGDNLALMYAGGAAKLVVEGGIFRFEGVIPPDYGPAIELVSRERRHDKLGLGSIAGGVLITPPQPLPQPPVVTEDETSERLAAWLVSMCACPEARAKFVGMMPYQAWAVATEAERDWAMRSNWPWSIVGAEL